MSKPKGPMRALHELLKRHWTERRLFWGGEFDPKRPVRIDISTFNCLMTLMQDALSKEEWEIVDETVGFIPLYEAFLTNPRYAGHAPHLANLVNAVARRNQAKANLHLKRLTGIVHRVAADRTFRDGERVSIIRSEHGWYDGRLAGTVKPGSGGHVVVDEDGTEHQIRHLRDIH